MVRPSLVIAICAVFIACKESVVEPQPSEVLRPVLTPLTTDAALTDLGTLGGCCSKAFAINNAGQIVGESQTVEDLPHAVLWQNGTMTDLGTLGGIWSRATGINNGGQVVGVSHTATGTFHAFLWANGAMTDLGTLGDGSSSAEAINDLGQVVGISNGQAFLWQSGTMTPLGTSQFASTSAINLSAQVVGSLEYGPYTHAGFWKDGVVTDLGTLGGCCSGAIDVNDVGTVVGWASAPGDVVHAVLWQGGTVKDLGVIGGAIAINEEGQIVGSTMDYRAFLLTQGSLIDLGTLGGYPKSYASGINDQGQIVGYGCTDRYEACHAVLWPFTEGAYAGGPYNGIEGRAVSFNGTGPSGTTSFSWSFGDASAAGTGATPSHVYKDNGTYTVTLTVSDGSNSTTATTTATIANVAPLATFRAVRSLDAKENADTVNEGTAIKLGFFNPTDPSPVDLAAGFQYAYDCGSGYGAFTKKTRTYCPTVDQGLRSVGAKIRDKDGGVTEYRAVVPVVNHKPHVELTTTQGPTSPLGSARTVSGTFRDPGLLDAPWAWTVDWGDGSTSNGATPTQPGPISASHVYTRLGTFRVRMFVTDKDGGTGKSNSVYVQVVAGGGVVCPSPKANAVLVDASRDGGGWWFPQSGPFSSDSYHQGQALADYLRSKTYMVQELGRGTTITDSLLLASKVVIRANVYGSYTASELQAYQHFLACQRTLLLLGDYVSQAYPDQLAQMIGVTFTGTAFGYLTQFAAHPITAGVGPLLYNAGALVAAGYPSTVQILGWLSSGEPVMGVVDHGTAKVFFIGDVNGIESVPQPLVDNLISWGF